MESTFSLPKANPSCTLLMIVAVAATPFFHKHTRSPVREKKEIRRERGRSHHACRCTTVPPCHCPTRRASPPLPSRGEVAVVVLCGRAVFAVLGDPRAEGARAGVKDGAAVAAVKAATSCAAIVP
ncbi:uncharacterized protein DS421_16g546390 [Arachis hypogaea]|nr:uncharacterized protein DS421_16g546390 [Arachis hypogaea]